MNYRITRNRMFADMVSTVSKRSTCNRRQVGALIVLGGRILSMGYAGSPAGTPHCLDAGCLIGPEGGCIRTQHAEANAIAWAARKGIGIEGAAIWCTYTPCVSCAKLIINSGIREFIALEEYRDKAGVELLQSVGILVTIYAGD